MSDFAYPLHEECGVFGIYDRADLVQDLADLKPGIFRFPGGCIVEGTDLDTRYEWKNSVGFQDNIRGIPFGLFPSPIAGCFP